MDLHLRFWREEIPLRVRSWRRRHWWPAVIRQRTEERDAWRRWCEAAEAQQHGWNYPDDLIEAAWGIIANASDWNTEGRGEWRGAAERWREGFHDLLAANASTDQPTSAECSQPVDG